jgi:sugar phosphate isomerase/epimerase
MVSEPPLAAFGTPHTDCLSLEPPMVPVDRRTFLQVAAAGVAAGALTGRAMAAEQPRRKFTMAFTPGSIGVKADQREAIRLAHEYGFESVEPSAHFLAGLSDDDLAALLADLKAKNLVWAAAGLPVEFRRDDDAFNRDLKQLPTLAAGLQRAGVTRVGTWISPSHDSLTYVQNFRQHAERLGKVAAVLADHNLRLGLEYVGPKTSWTRGRYPFVHSMAEMRDLIGEIRRKNVGLLLDSWHWYTAGDSEADLLALANDDVVACDLNDAPAGIPRDEQVDSRRELPVATGVIDLKTFLGALVKIGYDGPVRAEPFNQGLNAMENEEAAAATAAAMKKAFALVE